MIYFIILFFLLICVYRFDYCGRKKYRTLSFWTLFIIFIVLAGMRYRIGIDSARYEGYYPEWPTLWDLATYRFDYTRYDPGFIVIASIPRTISADFTVMQFFEATVVSIGIFWFASRNTKHVFLCLTFFYISQYLNLMTEVMREAFAVVLFLFSWPSFRDGKWWLYFTFCLGVMMMHTSGVFTFLLPLMCIKGVRQLFYFGRRTIIISALILAAGYVVQIYFYDLFRALAFTDRMMDRAQVYSEGDLSGQIVNINGIIGLFFRYAFYPIVALYFYNKKIKQMDKEQRQKYRKFEMMVVLGLYISLISIPVFIFQRYTNYLCMFTFCFVSDWAFSKIKIHHKVYRFRPVYWFLFFIPMFVFQGLSYSSDFNKSGTLKTYMAYYPYVTRLNPHTDPQREELFRYEQHRR